MWTGCGLGVDWVWTGLVWTGMGMGREVISVLGLDKARGEYCSLLHGMDASAECGLQSAKCKVRAAEWQIVECGV